MKAFFLLVSAVALVCGQSRLERTGVVNFQRRQPLETPQERVRREAVNAQNEAQVRAERAKEWRVVEGQTNNMNASGWSTFEGKVLESYGNGIRVARYADGSGDPFWLENYPDKLPDGSYISGRAKRVGLKSYTTVLGGTATIPKFDHGIPCEAPKPSAAETALAQARAEQAAADAAKAKAAMDARTLKYQLEQAEKGLPSFQYEVGKRYLRGEGVEKDEAKARAWFAKAAAQGESLAKKALEELPK